MIRWHLFDLMVLIGSILLWWSDKLLKQWIEFWGLILGFEQITDEELIEEIKNKIREL